MKRMLFAIAALVSSVGLSSAADVGVWHKPTAKTTAYVPYNWSGVYIGLNGGAGIGTTGASAASSGPFSALVPNDPADRMKGWMFGGQIGARQQVGVWVFGLEADIDWTNISNRSTSGNTVRRTFLATQLADTASSQTNGTRLDWLSTVTANVGVTPLHNVLWSLKGGLAFGKVTWDQAANVSTTTLSPTGVAFCAGGIISCPSGSGAAAESKTKYGWTLGTVIEVALNRNWSLKGEVDYVDLGSVGGTIAGGGSAIATSQNVHLWVSKAGVNFRF